jgi:hypothetical protein
MDRDAALLYHLRQLLEHAWEAALASMGISRAVAVVDEELRATISKGTGKKRRRKA